MGKRTAPADPSPQNAHLISNKGAINLDYISLRKISVRMAVARDLRCGSALVALALTILVAEPAHAQRVCLPPHCVGDCDGNGAVTVEELVRGVGMVLDRVPVSECPSFDDDMDGRVSVAELVRSVSRLIEGCSAQPSSHPPESLVDHFEWDMVSGDEDPFVSMRPEGAMCSPTAFRFEVIGGESSFEVKSEQCNYLTAMQPALIAVQKGEEIYIRLWHFQLSAPAGALAYMAVAIGDCVVWQEQRRIPAPSELLISSFPAPFDIPEGTPIYFHVQNHGANSYHLIEVTAGGSLIE